MAAGFLRRVLCCREQLRATGDGELLQVGRDLVGIVSEGLPSVNLDCFESDLGWDEVFEVLDAVGADVELRDVHAAEREDEFVFDESLPSVPSM